MVVENEIDSNTNEEEKYEMIVKTRNVDYISKLKDKSKRIECFLEIITSIEPINYNLLYKYICSIDSDDLKIKYLSVFPNYQDRISIIRTLKDNNRLLECIYFFDEDDCKSIVISLINNDDDKIKCLDSIKNDFYKSFIIRKIKNEDKRIKCLKYVSEFIYKKEIIDTIISDDIKLKYYENFPTNIRIIIIISLSDDNVKEELLNNYEIDRQVEIILSFKDDLLKLKYANMVKYDDYKVSIICSINDKELIKKSFLADNSIEFRLRLITEINDMSIQADLINMLEPSVYKSMLITNSNEEKEKIMDSINLENLSYDIDQDITIGIELETSHKCAKLINIINNTFVNWNVKEECSVSNGVEIVSPIIRYNCENLKELYYICTFIENYNFHTISSCGGHIHIGFNYFKNMNQLNTFLNLYGNVENILYIISNKEGSKPRGKVKTYAKSILPILKKISLLDLKQIVFDDYVSLIQSMQHDRKYAINFKNANNRLDKNTLEFRFPNGEIDFNELLYNIRLICKLVEKAKIISNKENKSLAYLYNLIINEDSNNDLKLEILLRILFDSEDERIIYRNRYYKNCSFCNRKQKKNKILIKN